MTDRSAPSVRQLLAALHAYRLQAPWAEANRAAVHYTADSSVIGSSRFR